MSSGIGGKCVHPLISLHAVVSLSKNPSLVPGCRSGNPMFLRDPWIKSKEECALVRLITLTTLITFMISSQKEDTLKMQNDQGGLKIC